MVVEIERQEDVCVLRFKGRFLTGTDREYLCSKADEVRQGNSDKVLADFQDVPYLDSTGIGFIVSLYTSVTKKPNGRFVLAAPNDRVRMALDVTGLSSIIPMVTDMAAAFDLLRERLAVAS